MQTDSTVDDILKAVDRFRILCVGRSGVGKSSVINRVFGLKEASVAHWKVGSADIDRELTSPENQFFVLHDSMGFEAGDTQNFEVVSKFVRDRRDKSLPLKDRLHAVWLCTETPTAGGRVFETGDEKLLQLAYQTETPVVVVFTKYDRLLRSKKIELRGDNDNPDPEDLVRRSQEEARKVLDRCVQSLEGAMNRLETQMPRHVNVSIQRGYEYLMSSLVGVTRDVVQEKLKGDAWVMWAIAQRASLPLKIDACAATGVVYYGRSLDGDMPVVGRVLLRDCLTELHQDIVTCWNFKDEEKILSNDGFKQLIRYLVQDVQESQNRGESHYTPSPAIAKISETLSPITTTSSPTVPSPGTSVFADWLKDAVLHNAPQVRVLLMSYIVDLTTVLRSLFDITLASQSSGKTTWMELKGAFEEYEGSGSRQRIHHRICAIFQQDQQIVDPDSFRRLFDELVKVAGVLASVPAPLSSPVTTPKSTLVAKSNPMTGAASNSAPVSTSNPAPVTTSSTTRGATAEPASEPSRRRRGFPCLCQ